MLVIRLQRIGRKGYPVYRLAVQDARRHPKSGKVVDYVGSYNPHTKETNISKDLIQKYLDNGAQPSPRVVKLLVEAGVKMPSWVKKADKTKNKVIKKPTKLRKNNPSDEVTEVAKSSETDEVEADDTSVDTPVDDTKA